MSKKFIKQKRVDGWQNLATLLGTGADKRTAAQLTWEARDPQFFEEMYAGGGIPARIVDLVPESSLRHWVEWTGVDQDKSDEVNTLCEKLDVRGALLKSWKWGRAYGGACCHIVTDTTDPASPLQDGEQVIGLRDLSRWDLRILTTDIEYDFGSPNWGMPRIYYLNVQMGSQYKAYPIHWTRMIRFDGQLVPRRTYIRNNYWHDSILNRLYNSIRNYEQANDSVAACLMDFNVDVFKMKNLANLMGSGKEGLVKARLEMLQYSKSVINGVMIDADEEDYINVGRSMQGVAELLVLQANRLVAETDIPHTLLLGESPDGSNATGNSTSQSWYNYIATEQENYLRPKLDRIIKLLVPDEEKLGFKFKPLRVLDDIEMADVKNKNAQTDSIYIQDGVLAPEEVAESRFGGETYSMEITIDEEGREAGTVVPQQQEMQEGDPNAEDEDGDGEKKPLPGGKPKKPPSPKSDSFPVGGLQPPEGNGEEHDFPLEEKRGKAEGKARPAKTQGISVEGQGIGEEQPESVAIRGGVSQFEPVNQMVSGGDKPAVETFISQTMSEPFRDPRTDPHLPGPGIPNKPRLILPTRGNGITAQSGSSPLDAGMEGTSREGLSKEGGQSAEENQAHAYDSAEPARKRAATVIVKRGNKFLMGKTNEGGKYTLPGGWVEDKESMHQGGIRELAEESGLKAEKLKFLGSRRVEAQKDKPVEVAMYEFNHDGNERPTGKNDPDSEVGKWEWFDHTKPLSDEVLGNLKHPNNIALAHMGLLKDRNDAAWNENDHPRAANGQFGSGGGGASNGAAQKKSPEIGKPIAPKAAAPAAMKMKLTGPYEKMGKSATFSSRKGADLDHSQIQSVHHAFEAETGVVKDKLASFSNYLAATQGINVLKVEARAKDVSSLKDKMNGKWKNKTLSEGSDFVGGRMVFRTQDEVNAAIAELQSHTGFTPIEHDDFVKSPRPGGYRAHHIILRTPNGMNIEMQMQTKNQSIGQKYTHDIYKPPAGSKWASLSEQELGEASAYGEQVSNYLAALDSGEIPGQRPEAPKALESRGLAFDWSKAEALHYE